MTVIQSYTDLRAGISSYLWDRADIYNLIPTFIQLAEAQMNRRLRSRRMMVRATATIDAEFVMLPANFAGARAVYIDGQSKAPLEFVTDPDAMAAKKAHLRQAGEPTCYTVIGRQFEFWPVPAQTFTAQLVYYERIPALSDVTPTNWLLTEHPDVYLYGALLQSAPWLKEDDRVNTWGTLFTTLISDMKDDDLLTRSAHRIAMPERGGVF